MVDINLTYGGTKFKGSETESVCANAKVKHSGVQVPEPCKGSGGEIVSGDWDVFKFQKYIYVIEILCHYFFGFSVL